MFIKQFTILTSSLFKYQLFLDRVWLFIEPFTQLTSPLRKSKSPSNEDKEEESTLPAGNLASHILQITILFYY